MTILTRLWRCKISFETKYRLYKWLIVSFPLYGCELCTRQREWSKSLYRACRNCQNLISLRDVFCWFINYSMIFRMVSQLQRGEHIFNSRPYSVKYGRVRRWGCYVILLFLWWRFLLFETFSRRRKKKCVIFFMFSSNNLLIEVSMLSGWFNGFIGS